MIKLERQSMLTGKVNVMTLDTTQEKLNIFFNQTDRPLIQEIFPNLSTDEREFIQTGATPEEWGTAELDLAINVADEFIE